MRWAEDLFEIELPGTWAAPEVYEDGWRVRRDDSGTRELLVSLTALDAQELPDDSEMESLIDLSRAALVGLVPDSFSSPITRIAADEPLRVGLDFDEPTYFPGDDVYVAYLGALNELHGTAFVVCVAKTAPLHGDRSYLATLRWTSRYVDDVDLEERVDEASAAFDTLALGPDD